MIVAAGVSAGATKILGPGAVVGVLAAAAAPFTDPAVMVAALATVGTIATAWVNSRASRNKASLDVLRADMTEARDRADEAAELVRKLDQELHQVRTQLTRFEIGTQRLVGQLVVLGVDPVWRPDAAA